MSHRRLTPNCALGNRTCHFIQYHWMPRGLSMTTGLWESGMAKIRFGDIQERYCKSINPPAVAKLLLT